MLRAASDAPARELDFIVVLAAQADVSGAARFATKLEKGNYVYQRLTEVARQSQPAVLAELKQQGLACEPFWVANMIRVRGPIAAVRMMAERADVSRIHANPTVHFADPQPEQMRRRAVADAVAAIEPNISRINAPDVWALGYTGQGIVVGGNDTGYRWDHTALKGKYRGWDGTAADHNYNWHDSIHSGGGSCGPNTTIPCDDAGHGTHTMGIMLGDDGAGNQIGVAPGAKWVGCRCMDQGNGTPATYTECLQWFIAPTNSLGQNPDPAKAPDVINNSWNCPASEGCTDVNVLKTAIESVRAAGIVVVVSAGNSGPNCTTVSDPPTFYDASTTVGATDNNDNIAGFSSRGQVTADGSGRLKPDVSAPGVSVRSSYRNSTTDYQFLSGTSMAAPHVAGTTALILSAHPDLRGHVDAIETLLEQSAVPLTTTQNCGAILGTQVPNNTFGWGRIDALAAVGLSDSDGDGMLDWQENLAGTDRNDANSLQRVIAIAHGAGQSAVTFTSVAGKHYRLESSPGLLPPAWTTAVDNLLADGPTLQAVDPMASGAERFYRAVLIP
ncbi:MAG: S8 family serine peptidase [Verrucomicrobiota bacterium]|nr:S8 family serine peptidase [Verrucomicrobiota bacterium]